MKNKKLLLFVEISAILAFAAFIIFGLEKLYSDEKTDIDRLFNQIHAHRNMQLGIVGNSHLGPVRNIDILNIDREYILNASIGGQDMFHAYFLIKEMLKSAPEVKYILLGVDYDMFGYSLNSTNQKFIARQYYLHTDTMEDISLPNRIMATSNFFRTNRDVSHIFSKIKHVFSSSKSVGINSKPLNNEIENFNFIPVASIDGQKPEFCRKRALEQTSIKFSEKEIEQNKLTLNKIINLTEKTQTRLIIVVTPKKQCFYESSNAENTLKGKNALYDIVGKAEQKATLIDFTSENFPDSLFIDPDHLNRQGVEKMVEFINNFAFNH